MLTANAQAAGFDVRSPGLLVCISSMQKAIEALPEGGAFIAIGNLIDGARRENAFALLMSLNMQIEFGDAIDSIAA